MNKTLEVKKQILLCTRCKLSQQCRSPIPLTSPSSQTGPTFTVLGEAPGRMEDQQGKPFVGPAGRILRRELDSVGLESDNAYYMNVVCCWPRGKPDNGSLGACRENLKAQLDITPKFVLVCGSVALKSMIPHANLQHATGKLIRIHDKLLFPVIHPSYFLHKPNDTETFASWQGMLGKFSFMLQWGAYGFLFDRCIYCDGPGFPACRKHLGYWQADKKWQAGRKRSKKKGLQDERLF